MNELVEQGIVFGIDHDAIAEALSLTESDHTICVAHGEEPRPRTASLIELAFTQEQTSGTLNEETQRMDFRERGGVHSVLEGDPVGVWFPGNIGTPGKGVDGERVEPGEPEGVNQSRGANIRGEPSKDGQLELFAEINGVVRMGPNGDLYVTNVLEVPSDVDLDSGNIHAGGSVSIAGTVHSGFTVNAGDDIEVDGTIENASIHAGKSLFVGAGILGGDLGEVFAKEEIRVKFAQNASLTSEGNVRIEVDTNSAIKAGKSILAKDGHGRLRGGTYQARESIVAKELGSPQGVATRAYVGVDPVQLRELHKIRNEVRRAQSQGKKVQRLRDTLEAKRDAQGLTPELAAELRTCMRDQLEVNQAIESKEAQRDESERALRTDQPPVLRIEHTIHAGVQIQIGDAFLQIDHTRRGGVFRLDPETKEIVSS